MSKLEFSSDENDLMQEALVVFFEDALSKNSSGSYNRETKIVNELLERLAQAK
tara:strand:+ start:529 stop:687 length:159 start_codon:yes stop_codon:yes gene_type:complete